MTRLVRRTMSRVPVPMIGAISVAAVSAQDMEDAAGLSTASDASPEWSWIRPATVTISTHLGDLLARCRQGAVLPRIRGDKPGKTGTNGRPAAWQGAARGPWHLRPRIEVAHDPRPAPAGSPNRRQTFAVRLITIGAPLIIHSVEARSGISASCLFNVVCAGEREVGLSEANGTNSHRDRSGHECACRRAHRHARRRRLDAKGGSRAANAASDCDNHAGAPIDRCIATSHGLRRGKPNAGIGGRSPRSRDGGLAIHEPCRLGGGIAGYRFGAAECDRDGVASGALDRPIRRRR